MNPILIIVIGMILIGLNIKAIKKEDKSFENILERASDISTRDYDVEIISIRKDLAETVLDLQMEIEELKTYILDIKNVDANNDNSKEEFFDEELSLNNTENMDSILKNSNANINVISEINFSNKIESKSKIELVKEYLENDFTEEEICEKLSIGRGEVLLIKGLLKS